MNFQIATAQQLSSYGNLFNLYQTLTTANGNRFPVFGSHPFLIDNANNPLPTLIAAMAAGDPDTAWPHDLTKELERIGSMLALSRYTRADIHLLEHHAARILRMVCILAELNREDIALPEQVMTLEELDALRAQQRSHLH